MSTVEENKALVRRFFEELWKLRSVNTLLWIAMRLETKDVVITPI